MTTTTSPTLRAMLEASQKLEETGQSPLALVNPEALEELWAKFNSRLDRGLPQAILDDDEKELLTSMVLVYRDRRMVFKEKELVNANKPKRKAKAESTPTSSVPAVALDISDLE